MPLRISSRATDNAPLQFGMRTLLLVPVICAAVMMVWQHGGPMWGATVVWFLVLLAAHVAANAHGTRQTRAATAALADESPDEAHRRSLTAAAEIRFAPDTRLRHRLGPGRVLSLVTAAGAIVGLLVGTTALAFFTLADEGGLLLGAISSAVLGGFLGYATGSFTIVASRAFREAALGRHAFLPANSGD